MIADDDRGIVDFLSIMLKFKGYEVCSTLNGVTLLNMNNHLPDLLLLDIWMSGIDGREICNHLKKTAFTRTLPILMFSASKDIERSAMDAGADAFLAKPFEMDEMLKKIKENIS